MKYFCYLFSLYFLALSAMPCTDIHDVSSSATAALENISTPNDEHHHAAQDTCPPFCTCSCCGHLLLTPTSILEVAFQAQLYSHQFSKKNKFSFAQHWKSHSIHSIFRPPQAG